MIAALMAIGLLGCVKPAPPAPVVSNAPAPPVVAESAPEEPDPLMVADFRAVAMHFARGDVLAARDGTVAFRAKYPGSPAMGALDAWGMDLVRIGKPAPDLTPVRWLAESGAYASGATLIVLFEPWCRHCHAEMPVLAQVYDRYAAKGLGVLAITPLSRDSTDEEALALLRASGAAFPVGHDPEGSIARSLAIVGVPHLLLVREGSIIWSGSAELLSLQLLDHALSGAPMPVPSAVMDAAGG